MKSLIQKLLREGLTEVKYVDTSNMIDPNNRESISDSETIRVFHGFNDFKDVQKILRVGLSGKERARRIYSYESGNNPFGLFISIDFNLIKRAGFAHSGVIIEFSTKVSDLEAPVWVGGRSYFVQGEYTKSFKDMDEREQQRLLNRQKAGESPYDYIKKSDRPELAEVIFDNPEHQALYIGDLNPNMIKYVWYNEVLHKQRKTNGEWVRMSRKDFINKSKIETKRDKYEVFLPTDDFDFDKLVNRVYGDKVNSSNILTLIKYLIRWGEYELKETLHFFPKQINQVMKLKAEGYFDELLKKYDNEKGG